MNNGNLSHSDSILKNKLLSTQNIVLIGLFTAVLTVISQISIPMPIGMPLTIQVFGITLTGIILGWKLGFLTTITYILIGAVGIPVFANFHGGISSLVGIRGGYIWTWPIMVLFCGIRPRTSVKAWNITLMILFSLIGLTINEIAGGLQWAALSGDMSVWGVFTYSMVAFVPKDIIITIVAVFTGVKIRDILIKPGS